ncbi:MAG: phosphodiester glycosidase family protein [Oscillospiraceae bacterium]|nr:phosphodiester glycosidase family protein [Oscillospiraceae bacterium]
MQGFFKKPYRYALIYSCVLILFTVYVLLDTFVIPHRQEKAKDPHSVTDVCSTDNSMCISSAAARTDSSKAETAGNNYTVTDSSYKDDNISIDISEINKYDTHIYIADIRLSSADLLKTAFAENTFGRNIKAKTSEIAQESNAVFAVNGDYCGFRDYGYVIRNSNVYRNKAGDGDALIISKDGTMSAVSEKDSDAEELVQNGVVQALSFGPVLVTDSMTAVSENEEVARAKNSNPRTAVGMIEPLHYIFIVADGRTSESKGLSLYELAGIMADKRCTFAYNLDGGGSSAMWFNGQIINHPTDGRSEGERSVSDIVYIGY